jgi:diamine N-acetyltransferase
MESPGRPESTPISTIVGERVTLGPLRRDLLPTYQRWYNDFIMRRTFGGWTLWTAERQARWYAGRAVSDGSEAMFTIYAREVSGASRPIGTTLLADIDHRDRTAEYAILIGEGASRGHGYGTETTRLMLDYAFTALGLHSVWLSVFAFNLAGIRAYEKAGFREVARRRQAYLIAAQMWDLVYMDCLAREFPYPVLYRVFAPDEPPAGRSG